MEEIEKALLIEVIPILNELAITKHKIFQLEVLPFKHAEPYIGILRNKYIGLADELVQKLTESGAIDISIINPPSQA